MGIAGRELFAQFMIRIYKEIPACKLAMFSKLKNLQAPNFKLFRSSVKASPKKLFLVPSSTFDNVRGSFPIAFSIWDLDKVKAFTSILADAYDRDGTFLYKKSIYSYDDQKGNIGSWVLSHKDDKGIRLGFMSNGRNDFQNQNLVYIINKKEQMPTPRGWWITPNNLIVMSIFLAVRKSIPATWLNDRDQFLYPNDGWKNDMEFQTDCLVYTLFNNNIQSNFGTNYWIPFTEDEVGAQEAFDSHFMSDFLHGKVLDPKMNAVVLKEMPVQQDLFAAEPLAVAKQCPLGIINKGYVPLDSLTPEAKAVMDAGRELWRYYHCQPNANPNASLYDIRLHFQGYKTTKSGKVQMNTQSNDGHYTDLITNLRNALKVLSKSIEPKVYDYGFLLR